MSGVNSDGRRDGERREAEADGVDAIPLALPTGRQAPIYRSVVKDVAEVRAAVLADDFSTRHAAARVRAERDMFEVDRVGEARPARARVKLGLTREELGATDSAGVRSLFVMIHIFPREGCLGAAKSRDTFQFW